MGPLALDIDLDRLGAPLLESPSGLTPAKARDLAVSSCDVAHARLLIERWHSRLPSTQPNPWQYAFRAAFDGITYGVALWHNPSARTLPDHWLELRRLAIAPDAPHCAASRMLGEMARFFGKHCPERERMISYQDPSVHTGTIYRAAGWHVAYVGASRVRDRSTTRPGGRMYRWNDNGDDVDSVGKIRWEKAL